MKKNIIAIILALAIGAIGMYHYMIYNLSGEYMSDKIISIHSA